MHIVDNVDFVRIYWVRGGGMSRGKLARTVVNDPPSSGWQHAFILRGEKRSTIVCPFTLCSYHVSNTCGEISSCREASAFDVDKMADMLKDTWKRFQSYGWQRDYDTVALLMRKLGLSVPEQVIKGGDDDTRRRGGKETESQLKKPVKLAGKRGKFLLWFLEAESYTRSVREAMAEFDMSRSNALSYLYMLQKDHGIGYNLVGDMATVSLPQGCENPFDEDIKLSAATPDTEASEDLDDDAWLD